MTKEKILYLFYLIAGQATSNSFIPSFTVLPDSRAQKEINEDVD